MRSAVCLGRLQRLLVIRTFVFIYLLATIASCRGMDSEDIRALDTIEQALAEMTHEKLVAFVTLKRDTGMADWCKDQASRFQLDPNAHSGAEGVVLTACNSMWRGAAETPPETSQKKAGKP